MIAASVRRLRLPRPLVLGTIVAAWGVALAAEVAGRGEQIHHDVLLEGGLPVPAALGLFIVAWQVMIAAMMLPSALPLIALFERTSASQPRHRTARAAFLGGYAAVWTSFGLIAFLGDALLHEVVHRVAWLEARPEVIAGAVLVGAGGFQFSELKERCLDECRHPAAYLLRHYRRGSAAAFRLGWGHGMFCLGCCWALMLVSFAVGVANLAWMAVLALLMVFEKTGPGGDRGAAPIGIALIVLGGVVALVPTAAAWLGLA